MYITLFDPIIIKDKKKEPGIAHWFFLIIILTTIV
jgi:hypothetical protein